MTIETTDLNDAITRLNPTDNDTVTFDTGRIWDSLSFWNALPRMKTVDVTGEQRQRLLAQAEFVAKRVEGYQNEDQKLDWESIPQFMTLVNEFVGVKSYVALPSWNMIIYESEHDENAPEPGLSCVIVKDGKLTSPYAPHFIFDIDDGFFNSSGDVPSELTNAFQKWVENGRVGPVLSF